MSHREQGYYWVEIEEDGSFSFGDKAFSRGGREGAAASSRCFLFAWGTGLGAATKEGNTLLIRILDTV